MILDAPHVRKTGDSTFCPKKLEGKVAIVTGGASGIGKATSRHFANHGPIAVVIADVQDEKGSEVALSIGSHRCTLIKCDVTDELRVQSAVESTVKIYGRVDIMFSNAGIGSMCEQGILDFDLGAYEKLVKSTAKANAQGTAACGKHAPRAMVDGGVKGSIVCTASVMATWVSTNVDYTMSKHAVLGLARSPSRGLSNSGIRVNCVSPAAVATPHLCRMFGASPEEFEKLFEPFVYLEKCGALNGEHVADAVLFLASDGSQFITGQNLVIDGGNRPH
ncbi:Isopiperitenol dehydrogenase [Bertholletia excelsa]